MRRVMRLRVDRPATRGPAALRRVAGSLALAALALTAGCARPAPPQELAAPARRGAVATRSPVVPCSTTYLGIATVSHCGPDGFQLGVAGD